MARPISHFIQEDSGEVVGRAMAVWMKANALTGMIRTRRAALAQSGNRFSIATNAERACPEIMLKQMIEPNRIAAAGCLIRSPRSSGPQEYRLVWLTFR